MTACPQAMVIGIGSDHGDDRAGWMVTDLLRRRCPETVTYRNVSTPIDMIQWLEAADRIHVVDTATALKASVLRFNCGLEHHRSRIAELPPSGTHGLGLNRVLKLAESLDRRTDHVNLWLVSGRQFLPFTAVSQTACEAIEECVRQLIGELLPRPKP